MEEMNRDYFIGRISHYDRLQKVADEAGNHNVARAYRRARDVVALKVYSEPFCYHDGINDHREICECGARKDER